MTLLQRAIPMAIFCWLLLTGQGCSDTQGSINSTNDSKCTSYVNPFIGTDGVGNTHPGAVRPWGMAAISPQTFDFTEMHLSTGYRQGQDKIYGFSSINMSGVGCPGAGSIPFKFSSGSFSEEPKGSKFSNEWATPGYYSVRLDNEDITVHTSATVRSGIYQLELPAGSSHVYIDLTAQQGHIKGGTFENFDKQSAKGYQVDGFFCGSTNRFKIYFHAELDKPADSTFQIYKNKSDHFKQNLDNLPSGLVYQYESEQPHVVNLRLGLSFVSSDNARENLYTEQNGFDFERIRSDAEEQWEQELGKIQVEGGTSDERIVFYTALYHSLLMPMTFSDVNGDYVKQGSEEILSTSDYIRYSAYSLWDTYRTTHPLFALVYPERQLDMVKTMVDMYTEAGRLPKWEIFGTETNIMVGDPASIVIGDTYMRGIDQFDVERAYAAMVDQADRTDGNYIRRGLKEYKTYGYIPMDAEVSDVKNFQWFNGVVWGAVSTTMEFNLADFAISSMAKKLGKLDDHQKFLNRSMSFIQLYDPETGLLRPKNADGTWYSPFDPAQGLWDEMNFGLRGGPGFVEGSAWQYLFSAPHGIDTLKAVMGEEEFLRKLDEEFDAEHFDMTNEPDLGYPFMYNFTPQRAHKTSKRVQECLKKYFTNTDDGLPGNDDAGTMSAWVVFAMMGIYPDTPGDPMYQITTPTFDKIEIQLNPDFYGASQFVIEREGPLDGTIVSVSLNDQNVNYQIDHNLITSKNSSLVVKTSQPIH